MIELLFGGLHYVVHHALYAYELFLAEYNYRVYIMHVDVVDSFFVRYEYYIAALLYCKWIVGRYEVLQVRHFYSERTFKYYSGLLCITYFI